MEFADLKNKNEKDLREILKEIQGKIRETRFKLNEKQTKNVRSLRELKKTVARILTIFNQRKQASNK